MDRNHICGTIKEKIEDIKLKQAMITLSKMRGKAPRNTTEEERELIRNTVFDEFLK